MIELNIYVSQIKKFGKLWFYFNLFCYINGLSSNCFDENIHTPSIIYMSMKNMQQICLM